LRPKKYPARHSTQPLKQKYMLIVTITIYVLNADAAGVVVSLQKITVAYAVVAGG
jgi:hypothetical protein